MTEDRRIKKFILQLTNRSTSKKTCTNRQRENNENSQRDKKLKIVKMTYDTDTLKNTNRMNLRQVNELTHIHKVT